MRYSIEARSEYVHCTVVGRENADDMREFLHAVQSACVQHGCPNVLMCVRGSRAIFKPDDYGLTSYVPELLTPSCRIAMVGDTSELQVAHEYIELVARQKGIDARAFRDEAAALVWLLGAPEAGSGASSAARR